MAVGFWTAAGAAGVATGAARATGAATACVDNTPSTPGLAPGGGGGRSGSLRAPSAACVCDVTGIGDNSDTGASAAVWDALAFTVRVFTRLGLIGSVDPGAGAGRAGGMAAVVTVSCFGASCFCGGASLAVSLAGSGAFSADATRALTGRSVASGASATRGAVRLIAPSPTWASINSRMRASRAPPVRPPRTTATRCRLPRLTEVTRLKPDARV